MVLLHQILFNLAIAEAMLMLISAGHVPFLHRIAPTHLKLVIFSNFWLFVLISALILFTLYTF